MKKSNLILSLVALVSLVGCAEDNNSSSNKNNVNNSTSPVTNAVTSSSTSSLTQEEKDNALYLKVKEAVEEFKQGVDVLSTYQVEREKMTYDSIIDPEEYTLEESITESSIDNKKDIYYMKNISSYGDDSYKYGDINVMKKFNDNGLDCIYFENGNFDEHPKNEFFSISKYIEPADHNYDRYKENFNISMESLDNLFIALSYVEIENSFQKVIADSLENEELDYVTTSIKEREDSSIEFIVNLNAEAMDGNYKITINEKRTFVVDDEKLVSFGVDGKYKITSHDSEGKENYHQIFEYYLNNEFKYEFDKETYNNIGTYIEPLDHVLPYSNLYKEVTLNLNGQEFDATFQDDSGEENIENAIINGTYLFSVTMAIEIKDNKLYLDKEMTIPLDYENLTIEEYYKLDTLYGEVKTKEHSAIVFEDIFTEVNLSKEYEIATLSRNDILYSYHSFITEEEYVLDELGNSKPEYKVKINGVDHEYGSTITLENNKIYNVDYYILVDDSDVTAADVFKVLSVFSSSLL